MALTLASNAITFTDNTSLSSGVITAAQLSAGAIQESFGNTSGAFNFRNKIINGNFDIWQRGTSFTGGVYGADRWINNSFGTTCTMSRQEFPLGQIDVPNEPTYFCRMDITSVPNAGHNSALTQRIENVRTLAGKTITISFYAKADNTRTITVEFSQTFGSGGLPSSNVTSIGAIKKTLTTNWQLITTTINVPSIAEKIIGTDLNSSLSFFIWFDGGTNFDNRTNFLGHQSGTFDIAQVQIEEGPVATPFEQRPIGTELALCQRYFQFYELFSQNGSIKSYPHNMRTAPTITRVANHPTTVSAAPSLLASYPRNITLGNSGSTTAWAGIFSLNSEL
jgi:hypothetical protein